jgi:hypothetical protein
VIETPSGNPLKVPASPPVLSIMMTAAGGEKDETIACKLAPPRSTAPFTCTRGFPPGFPWSSKTDPEVKRNGPVVKMVVGV